MKIKCHTPVENKPNAKVIVWGFNNYKWYCPHKPIYIRTIKKFYKSIPTIAIGIIAIVALFK